MENRRRKTSLEAIANSYHKGRFKKLLVEADTWAQPSQWKLAIGLSRVVLDLIIKPWLQ